MFNISKNLGKEHATKDSEINYIESQHGYDGIEINKDQHKYYNKGSFALPESSTSAAFLYPVEEMGTGGSSVQNQMRTEKLSEKLLEETIDDMAERGTKPGFSEINGPCLNPKAADFVPLASLSELNKVANTALEVHSTAHLHLSGSSATYGASRKEKMQNPLKNRIPRQGGLSAAIANHGSSPEAFSLFPQESRSSSSETRGGRSGRGGGRGGRGGRGGGRGGFAGDQTKQFSRSAEAVGGPERAGHSRAGSFPLIGSRGGGNVYSGNHLLNFQYEPIQRGGRSHGSVQRRTQKWPNPFNKELFLQANFRFLVSDLGDYSAYTTDPDRALDWRQVASVEVESTAVPQCPICLEEPPMCPQITACGHLFCFPCILQYLSLGGQQEEEAEGPGGRKTRRERWKKCPLCFATVGASDLRSVKVHVRQALSAGHKLSLALLIRSKLSLIPYTRRSAASHGLLSLPHSDAAACHPFSKFTLVSPAGLESAAAAMAAELTAEVAGLERSGEEEEEGLGRLPFLLQALDCLHDRTQAFLEHRAHQFASSSPAAQRRITGQWRASVAPPLAGGAPAPSEGSGKLPEKGSDVSSATASAMARLKKEASWQYAPAFSDEEEGTGGEEGVEQQQKEPGRVGPGSEEAAAGDADRGHYLWYQSDDGRPFVLHSLSLKVLVGHCGGYEKLPDCINATVLEVQSETQTEVTRKRYRFLSHFPLTSTFHFVEIDLTPHVPKSAMAPFLPAIEKRSKLREQRKQQEIQEKAKAEREANKRHVRPSVPTAQDFVAILSAAQDVDVPEASFASTPEEPPFLAGSPAMASTGSPGLLFAQVTKLGYASGANSPQLNAEKASSSQSPVDLGVWGNLSKGKSFRNSRAIHEVPSGSSIPRNGSHVEIAMAGLESDSQVGKQGSHIPGGRNKKNKKGQITLMSTSARRG